MTSAGKKIFAGTVVTLGVPAETLHSFDLVGRGRFDLKSMPASDYKVAMSLRNSITAIFVYWDKNYKNAHQAIRELTRADDKLQGKIWLVYPPGYKGPKLSRDAAQKLGIMRSLELPRDMLVLQKILDGFAPARTPETSSENQKQGALPTPNALDPVTVIGQINRKWSGKVVNSQFDPHYDPNEESILPVFVYKEGAEAQAEDLCQVINNACNLEATAFNNADHLLTSVFTFGARAIAIWHDPNQKMFGSLLEQIAENRSRPIPPIMVIHPGRQALNSLVENHSHLFFDTVFEFTRARDQVRLAFDKLLKRTRIENESATLLLRRIRAGLAPKDGMSLRVAEGLSEKLRKKPGKTYWPDAEYCMHLLQAKEFIKAAEVVGRLRERHPSLFDPILLDHTVRYQRDKTHTSGIALVEEIKSSDFVTLDRLRRAAGLLYTWRKQKALEGLISFWKERSDIPKASDFWFAVSRFHKLQRDELQERAALLAAVQGNPFQSFHLEALAENLARAKDYKTAIDLFTWASQSFGANTQRIGFVLVRTWIARGDNNMAKSILDQFIKKDPDNESARQLYRRLFGTFDAVS